MSAELTTPIKIEIPGIGTIESADLYLKSEADKVIAEQREKYKELAKFHDKAIQACCDADKVIDHQKYKRCLAMVKWCHFWANYWDCCEPCDCSKFIAKVKFFRKWHKRWLKIAKQFKERKKNAED